MTPRIPEWLRWPARADGPVPWQTYAKRVGTYVALAFGVLVLALAAFVLALVPLAPGVDKLRELQSARPSVLMSVDGKKLTEFTRAQQENIPLAKVSPHVVKALIATEDARFYDHKGVDLYRTAGAAWRTLTGETQGGSTITQQLARNLFPEDIGRSRTLTRKVKELITALRIERTYTKAQILETYLNSAPFLYNVVGIEMAARTYYDTSAAELDELQSATLIGMLKGTKYYNPVLHPERARERRNVVLSQMVRRGVLAAERYEALRTQPLKVQLNRQPDILGEAPHFAMHLRKWLIEWADQNDYNLYTDGLVVHTTIDSRLQEAATRAVERQGKALQSVADVEWASPSPRVMSASTESYANARSRVDPWGYFWNSRRDLVRGFVRESPQFKEALKKAGNEDEAFKALMADKDFMERLRKDKTRLEAGFVAVDPSNGEVRAWVGSRDFSHDQYDHVVLAARQPGSTFKPFVYGAALEAGLNPDRSYMDQPVEIPLGDGTVWKPTDMKGTSGMPMTLRDGLVYSKNTITAQVARDIGVGRIVQTAQSLGVDQSKLDPVPSLALGTSPVTLLEMVNAYASIAQQGQYHKPILIRRITDRHGETLIEFAPETRRAMSSDSAVDLIDMMRGVVNRGTGTAMKTRFGIVSDIAGKTGTTQNNTDGWFILMHPSLVAGAWVGFNDSRVTMRSDHWGQGGHNAILLVGDFFRAAQKTGAFNTKATFPPPRRPAMQTLPAWPADHWSIERDAAEEQRRDDQVGDAGAITSANDVIVVRQSDGTIVIGDRASMTTSRHAADSSPPKSSAELDRMLQGMGREASAAPPPQAHPQAPIQTGPVMSSGTGAPPPEDQAIGQE